MQLFVVRHASYTPSFEDPLEGLSQEGIAEAKRLRTFFNKMHITFDLVFASTKKRANETASLLSDLIPHSYSPGLSAEALFDMIRKENENNILLVGHNPTLQNFALLYGVDVAFSPTTCVCFNHKKIKWLITPEIVSLLSTS